MKFKTIFFICALVAPSLGNAQNREMAYMRYEGNIGSSISITANIIRLYENLSGNYQYRYIEDDGITANRLSLAAK
jgi:hypothetical protein